jgi:hypothetical protein
MPAYRELADLAFHRDNRPPQAEGDPIAIGCHVDTQPVRVATDMQIGIERFTLYVEPSEERRGLFRASALDCAVPFAKVTRRGTPELLRVDVESTDQTKLPLDLKGLDTSLPLGIYDESRAGEALTLKMTVSFRDGFVCVRSQPTPDPETGNRRVIESINKRKVLNQLGKRAILGDTDDGDVLLATQALQIKRAESE